MGERAGLLLSVAIGTIGWLITHYVDRATQAPTVEYSLSSANCSGPPAKPTCDYRYTVSNLTRTQAFGSVQFEFISPRGGKAHKLWVEPVEPAHEGDVQPEVVDSTASFQLAPLLPGATVTIVVKATGPRPTMKVKSSEALRFSPLTLETDLVRNEMKLIVALILIWLTGFAYFVLRKPRKDLAPAPPARHVLWFGDPSALTADDKGGKP